MLICKVKINTYPDTLRLCQIEVSRQVFVSSSRYVTRFSLVQRRSSSRLVFEQCKPSKLLCTVWAFNQIFTVLNK